MRDVAYKIIIIEADERESPEANHALGKLYLTEMDFSEAVRGCKMLRACAQKRYLEKDSQSPWAEEARKNLETVAKKIKQVGESRENIHRDFLEACRKRDREQAWQAYKQSRITPSSYITGRLIDTYLSLALSGKSTEAGDYLSALPFLGDIELEKVNDRFTHDLAQFYRGASPQQLRKVSGARALVKTAYERPGQTRVDEAINHDRQAMELFNQAGDICESLMAQRFIGHCHFRQASPALSSSVLAPGYQECEARGIRFAIWDCS